MIKPLIGHTADDYTFFLKKKNLKSVLSIAKKNNDAFEKTW